MVPTEDVLSLAGERTKRIDRIVSEITSNLKLDCGEGCAYCCFGVPLWVNLIEAFHILEALNGLPIRERRKVANRLRSYEKEYRKEARRTGYEPVSPALEETIDVDRLGLVCGLGMNEVPCPFLENNLCMIYSRRPSMCRLTVFKDKETCRKDWENPIAFLWKNEISPFIDRVRKEFHRRWIKEISELEVLFPQLDVRRLERILLFLPEHLRFDPVKKVFKLRL